MVLRFNSCSHIDGKERLASKYMSFNWSTQGNATLAGKEAQVILDFAPEFTQRESTRASQRIATLAIRVSSIFDLMVEKWISMIEE
ncbi:hypothetical protein Tco_0837051 [Tanacetum coccineum]